MSLRKTLILLVGVVLAPVTASAYVGPGAGLGAIGALLALIGTLLLAIVGFVWYPVKRMLKKRSARSEESANSEEPPAAPGA